MSIYDEIYETAFNDELEKIAKAPEGYVKVPFREAFSKIPVSVGSGTGSEHLDAASKDLLEGISVGAGVGGLLAGGAGAALTKGGLKARGMAGAGFSIGGALLGAGIGAALDNRRETKLTNKNLEKEGLKSGRFHLYANPEAVKKFNLNIK